MAGKGGGAWKVAYADFVTAMMAFFLVMWLVGQDQQVKRAVSDYFNDPFNDSKIGNSKTATKTGAVSDGINAGNVPHSESVAMGRGRVSYTALDETSLATKLVSDWLHRNKKAREYWRDQGIRQRETAFGLKHINTKIGVEEVATQQLARQLRYEINRDVTAQTDSLCKDLLGEVISKVNWMEIAEDLLSH